MFKNWNKFNLRFFITLAIGGIVFIGISLVVFKEINEVNSKITVITEQEIPLANEIDSIVSTFNDNERILTKFSTEIQLNDKSQLPRAYVKKIEINNLLVKQNFLRAKDIVDKANINKESKEFAMLSLLTLEESFLDLESKINFTLNEVLLERDQKEKLNLLKEVEVSKTILARNIGYFKSEIQTILNSTTLELRTVVSSSFVYVIVLFGSYIICAGLILFYSFLYIFNPLSKTIGAIDLITQGKNHIKAFKKVKGNGLDHLISSIEKLYVNLKKTEKSLVDERNKALDSEKEKSQFLSVMSHEIRTPLNTIIGTTEILEECNINSDQRKLVESINRAGNNLLDIVNKVLDVSKIEAGEFELHEQIFNPREMIYEAVDLFKLKAKRKGISVHFFVDKNVPELLEGSDLHIKQIIVNLISNAVKFTEEGEVKISLLKVNEDKYRFQVVDSGVGIKEEYLSRIFTPFTQQDSSISVKYGGTGLGLSFCQKVLALMGSRIEVESKQNVGSKFYFDLELDEIIIRQEVKEEEINGLEKLKNITDANILIVDDSEDNINLLKLYFKPYKFNVDYAYNGKQAADMFNVKAYDVVVMDVQMPVMNGYDATRLIRKLEVEKSRTPCHIIALTAHAIASEKEKCFVAGCNEYLSKPVKKHELFDALFIGLQGIDSQYFQDLA
ncbi:ATP-binding protein [Halobacteriovorax sp. GB3]|uniref:hybrid sensor histidine kinase/response regulator n=1 Tax=Halobacteriovorax sp. GB3 TaxID=2719615 RepID=UPI0023630FCC|nr:ATP-binding protein [Halobacteriovorax sp. GB3]MDD0854679.1 ATP-binding protein [Halobacteriovorax sp. GB3]